MKLQIFIETGEGSVVIDKTFQIIDERAPSINLQDIVDEAVQSLKEVACDSGHDCHRSPEDGCGGCDLILDLILEAKRLTVHND